MKILNGVSLKMLIAIHFVLALAACSKVIPKKSTPQESQESSDAKDPAGSDTPSSDPSSEDPPPPKPLLEPICKNPILIDDPELTPITKREDFPKVNFQLSEIQMYWVWAVANNASYSASAKSANQFSVELDCNGVPDLESENYTRTTTDNQGGVTKETSTHTQNVSGFLKIGSDLNFASGKKTEFIRSIDATFKDGKLISKKSDLSAAPALEKSIFDQEKFSLDPILIGTDTYITVRFYSISEKTFEIRIKFEYAADKDGKRNLEYGRAVYVKTEAP